MTPEAGAAARLAVGATVIRRDVFRDRVWTAYPTRVIAHSDRALVLAHWPGVRVLVPTTWIAWLRGAPAAVREGAIPDMAKGRWDLDLWTWAETAWLHIFLPGRWFSVNAVIDEAGGGLRAWYVNFQMPYRRHGRYVDTFDLFLDLAVRPDLTFRWKDEGEYRLARRVGVVSAQEAAAVEAAREEALALIRAGGWPFDAGFDTWRRDETWPLPVLGADGSGGPATGAHGGAAPRGQAD